MKTTLHLNKAEVSEAVALFVCKKLGRSSLSDVLVTFTVSADYDHFDRPIGTHTISASATIEDKP